MNQMNFMENNPFLGTAYGTPKQARMTQPLTAEQIKMLKNNNDQFTLNVTEEDMLRSRCTHKTVDGKFATQANADGTVTCLICGETFNLFNEETDAAMEATECIMNILQSIKTYYVDMPEAVAVQFFQMIPFIKKIPKLYEIALKNFNAYDGATNVNNVGNTYGGFNMLNQLISPNQVVNPMSYNNAGYMPVMNPAMPMNGMPMQPQGMQMPQGGMPMGAMPMTANPFGYNMGYGTPAPNMGMGMPQGMPQPQGAEMTQAGQPAPQAGQPTVQTKVFNV